MADSSSVSEECKMKRLKRDNEALDRLSELPDSLIFLILSFLEMRDVVGTTLLSKRWNDLWTTIPFLRFENRWSENVAAFRNFVNRALLLWKGTKILKFKIDFGYAYKSFDELLYRDLHLWLRFVTERKVEQLHLDLPDIAPMVSNQLPRCLYECSSITQLSLDGCDSDICGDVHWVRLKTLKIVGSMASEELISKIVSGAPQLETFELRIGSTSLENWNIRSSSLKKLSIEKYMGSEEFHPLNYTKLTIWAPNLEALQILGPPYRKCLLMDVSSLSDVTLDIYDRWDVSIGKTLRQILPKFRHVEKLTLSSFCFKVLRVMTDKYSFPPLLNVKLLRFTCDLIKPIDIVCLLKIFPKLNMLVIDRKPTAHYPTCVENLLSKHGLEFEVNTLKSFLMQLRTVEIGLELFEDSIFPFIEFFLEHATMLEKMVIKKIGYKNVGSKNMFAAAQKLLSVQRSFPNVELIFCETDRVLSSDYDYW